MIPFIKAFQRISSGHLRSPSLGALSLASSDGAGGFAVRGAHQGARATQSWFGIFPERNVVPAWREDILGNLFEAQQRLGTAAEAGRKFCSPVFAGTEREPLVFAGLEFGPRKSSTSCTSVLPETWPLPLWHHVCRSPTGFAGQAAGCRAVTERPASWAMPGSVRGVSKQALQPHLQRPVNMKIFVQSPGVIAEPYRKEDLGSFFFRWFTKEGWVRRKKRVMDAVKTGYAIARLRQTNKGFRRPQFYRDVVSQYSQINTALARGDRSALRQLVTEKEFTNMKRELKHREDGGWVKVDWSMDLPVEAVNTVQARLMAVDKENLDNSFLQITVSIRTKQTFAAYDRKNNVVAGNPEKKIPVKDYWVFERPLIERNYKWLLAGRLSI